jgi:hypothetical protein
MDDGAAAAERRAQIFGVSAQVFEELHQCLEDAGNPYLAVYRQARTIPGDNVAIRIAADARLDQRRYNAPIVSEVAALIVDDGEALAASRDIILRKVGGGGLKRIYSTNQAYDALSYPLLFPRGEAGWHTGLKYAGDNHQTKLSLMDYVKFYMQVRENGMIWTANSKVYNPLHHAGRLFQPYVVDQFARIDQDRLHFLLKNQKKIRCELYQGLADHVNANDGDRVGRRTVLPSSYIGGPRHMSALYQDAMAVVRKFGKPDLFITMTCNPKWTEITAALEENQKSEDRPDIVARVFRLKLDEFIKELKKGIFGETVAHTYTVEFQKRGLPHAHIMVILKDKTRIRNDPDAFVSAEIPCKDTNPLLHAAVTRHMIHGPCGHLNRRSPCMVDGKCSKDFPKEFREETAVLDDSFPAYKRPDNGRTCTKKVGNRDVQVDNRWVVPYNSYCLMRFDCHINVEVCFALFFHHEQICSTVTMVKYLYKYICKGSDRMAVAIAGEEVDEIKNYLDCRYISPPEACWRILGFGLHGNSHTAYKLPVHLPNMHNVIFNDDDDLEEVLEASATTMLTEFFQLQYNRGGARVAIP